MKYKFEALDVWNLSLELNDLIYQISSKLPEIEKFNLRTQINRAVTSISLNIAEGSTSQSDGEQNKFLGYSLRSLIEVIACLRLIERKKYLNEDELWIDVENTAQRLFAKLQAFRKAISKQSK